MWLSYVPDTIYRVNREIWIERLMAPYVFSFMIDAESLLLGIGLGFLGALALVLVIRNF
jgi:hypothetical protein